MEELEKRIKSAKLIYVIEVKTLEGSGTEEDPYRIETSYWDIEGGMLCALLNT